MPWIEHTRTHVLTYTLLAAVSAVLLLGTAALQPRAGAEEHENGCNNVDLLNNNHEVHCCNGKEATIVGTEGPDILTGTIDDDVIVGLGGGDIIRGLRGDDTICAGDGGDIVNAGRDDDWVDGEGGSDILLGQRGGDHLIGSDGTDICRGGPGDDTIDESCEL